MKTLSKQHKSSGYTTNNEAIAEKTLQLLRLKNMEITYEDLDNEIIARRTEWLENNLTELKQKYRDLPPIEQAYKILYLDHMNIDSKLSKVKVLSPTKMRIDSYNFCPYLHACQKLDLDTKDVCPKINHNCFDIAVKVIDPRLKFYRNYDNIRPYSDYCEEYIELIEK